MNLNRKQIGIALVVFVYFFSYFLASIFPMIALNAPSLSPFFTLSVISLIVLYLLFIFPNVFWFIGKFKYQEVEWLRLHRILYWLGSFLIVVVVLPAPIFASLSSDLDMKMFVLSWFLIFGILFPFFFHQTTEAIGMDYVRVGRVGIPSLQRVSIFVELSRLKLRKQEKAGLDYLSASLKILRENLKKGKKTLRNLDISVSALDTISSFRQKIPFDQLLLLTNELRKLPVLCGIESGLHSFLDSQEIKWTLGFVEMPSKKRHERLAIFLEKYLLPSILVAITFLAVLPENTRASIMDFLQKAEWTWIFSMSVSFVLLAVWVNSYLSMKLLELFYVKRGDIEEMFTLQTEGKEHG